MSRMPRTTKVQHGTATMYGYGCRCTKCRDNWRELCAAYRRRRGIKTRDEWMAEKAARPFPHGTHNGYVNGRCRCDACREAATAYHRAHGTAGYARDKCGCGASKLKEADTCRACRLAAIEAPHGTESRYRRCRCDACRAAAAAARRDRRRRSSSAKPV